jgi:hypothetical protein
MIGTGQSSSPGSTEPAELVWKFIDASLHEYKGLKRLWASAGARRKAKPSAS